MNDTAPAADQPEMLPTPPVSPRRASNRTIVAKLLGRSRGATIAELQEATGWQPHSARAHLSGLRKGGRTLLKEERKSGETSYRLVAAVNPASEAAE